MWQLSAKLDKPLLIGHKLFKLLNGDPIREAKVLTLIQVMLMFTSPVMMKVILLRKFFEDLRIIQMYLCIQLKQVRVQSLFLLLFVQLVEP